MENFKLEIAEEEKSNRPLKYLTLGTDESKDILANIAALCEVYESRESSLFSALNESLNNEVLYRGEVTKSFIERLLLKEGYPLDAICYIIWSPQENIDQFKIDDLIKDWEYIWYATSDEAVILYMPYLNRIALVTDHGIIKTNF